MFACTRQRPETKPSGSSLRESMTARSHADSASHGRPSATGVGRPTYHASMPGHRISCPHCTKRSPNITLDDSDYAELLGIYLGDGHITFMERTQRLRIALDAAHPRIVEETDALLRRGFPENRVSRVLADRGHTVVLHVYNSHLFCLFPQAGPGKKHDRRLKFEAWQRDRIAAAPWSFLRGCIRSDGCVFINRTGPYRYLSYGFYNLSPEILALFVETCHSLGLRPCVYAKAVRLNRRDDVARLLEHVGRKG